MGHDKLRKFAQNETFSCLVQPDSRQLLSRGYENLCDHAMKGTWSQFFGGAEKPLVLELGCGKGEYTVGLARRHPSCNYVGVDVKGARLWRGAKTVTEEGIPNAAFLRTRVEFISAFFAPGEVSQIWLTFSDPQFKSENSRLTSPVFLSKYRKFLKSGGLVHLKTDSRFLHEYTKAVCAANGLRVRACTTDLYSLEPSAQFPAELFEVQTFYEKMFLEQGYKITYIAFEIGEGELKSPSDFDAAYWRSVEGPRLLFGHDSSETRRQKMKQQ